MRIYDRKLNRLKGFDYSFPGFYFVTICTKNMNHYFGKIQNGKMMLNKYGRIIDNKWNWLKSNFNYIELDTFIIMPNHVHGIIYIYNYNYDKKILGTGRAVGTGHAVGTGRDLSLPKIKPLPEIIGAFKTTSSKLIHEYGLAEFQWQRSFHDRIVRNENELERIRNYIKNNPVKWGLDRNNI